MTRRLAFALCDLAIIVLPRGRKHWGEAMKAELSYVAGGSAALAHATGCIAAAAKVRMFDFEARFAAGVGSLAMLSVAFGIYHIACASRGLDVMLGRPDGFLAALVRSGRASPDVIASYHQAMPFVVACLFALGFAHLTASYFLLRRDWDRFLIAWCGALLAAIAAVIVQLSVIWSSGGLPSELSRCWSRRSLCRCSCCGRTAGTGHWGGLNESHLPCRAGARRLCPSGHHGASLVPRGNNHRRIEARLGRQCLGRA